MPIAVSDESAWSKVVSRLASDSLWTSFIAAAEGTGVGAGGGALGAGPGDAGATAVGRGGGCVGGVCGAVWAGCECPFFCLFLNHQLGVRNPPPEARSCSRSLAA